MQHTTYLSSTCSTHLHVTTATPLKPSYSVVHICSLALQTTWVFWLPTGFPQTICLKKYELLSRLMLSIVAFLSLFLRKQGAWQMPHWDAMSILMRANPKWYNVRIHFSPRQFIWAKYYFTTNPTLWSWGLSQLEDSIDWGVIVCLLTLR